jgi:hypothetical protein
MSMLLLFRNWMCSLGKSSDDGNEPDIGKIAGRCGKYG